MSPHPPKPKYEPFPLHLLSQAGNIHQTYEGSCHCGQLKFHVRLSPPFPEHEVALCNCSICRRNGYVLVYPRREDVRFLCGEELMSEYKFHRHRASHRFCPRCGVSAYIDFNGEESKDVLGVNVRLIHEINVDGLTYTFVDGAGRGAGDQVD